MSTPLRRARRNQLIVGLSFGLLFGVALERSGVTSYDAILGTLRLEDLLLVKVLLTALAVGALGVYGLRQLGLVRLHLREASVGGNVLGGLVFGAGFALLGYCPATALGAAAQGRLDALVGGLTGMLVGSFAFAQAYSALKGVLSWGKMGKVTLWQVLGVSPWVVVIPLCVLLAALMRWLELTGR
jgi:hypothetical protein